MLLTRPAKRGPRIVADIFHGIEAAARRLHYGLLKPKAAFFCPACSPGLSCPPVHHLASVVDDELVCSVSRRKTGELTRQHTVWPLSVEDALHILGKLPHLLQLPEFIVPPLLPTSLSICTDIYSQTPGRTADFWYQTPGHTLGFQ